MLVGCPKTEEKQRRRRGTWREGPMEAYIRVGKALPGKLGLGKEARNSLVVSSGCSCAVCSLSRMQQKWSLGHCQIMTLVGRIRSQQPSITGFPKLYLRSTIQPTQLRTVTSTFPPDQQSTQLAAPWTTPESWVLHQAPSWGCSSHGSLWE